MENEKIEKKSIKGILKELAPGYIILFSLCYMLFFYEPLMMYATNKDDFWFDFGIMIGPVMGIFAIFFFGSAAVVTGLYFVCRLFVHKLLPYRITLCVIAAVFFTIYIQGNFLAGHLPALDGSAIDWSGRGLENIIFFTLLAIFAGTCVFISVSSGTGAFVKYAAAVSVVVFVMLTVSFVTTAAQKNLFQTKHGLLCTTSGFNTASSDKNFYIFVVDSQSAAMFTEVIASDDELRREFDDFTYYPDTLSVFAYTRDAVPFLLTGEANKNELPYSEYATNAYNNSELFKMLDERGYGINLYGGSISWYGEKNFEIENNPSASESDIEFGEFFKDEMRYVWFKYLPYVLKRYSDIENMDFDRCVERFSWYNDAIYREFTENPVLSKTSDARFAYIHAEGAHVPFDMDDSFNRIEGGTLYQKCRATAKLMAAFLQRLKANGVYDNSAIVLLADHGYTYTEDNTTYILKRFNPMLLIKGVGEKHDFYMSDKPISYYDLNGAYRDLLDGRKSTELFSDISYPRTRRVIWYEIYSEEHMVEYETDGAADQWELFRETNVFDL